MVFYLGSEKKLPEIEYDLAKPAFNTKELVEEEMSVLDKFTLPHVIYFGSNEGCGCSFQHAILDKNQWFPVIWHEGEEAEAGIKDHHDLVEFMKSSGLSKFEIYGCWDGDQKFPTLYTGKIKIEEILNPEFFFKERGYYFISTGG